MKKLTPLLFAFLFLGFVSCNEAEPTPDEQEEPKEEKTIETYSFVAVGNEYTVVKERMNWEDAAAYAVEQGGILLEINSKEENDAVFEEVVENSGIQIDLSVAPDGGMASYIWLGGNDLSTEGDWIWDGNNDGEGVQFWQGLTDGEVQNDQFTNWGNEPDNYGNQDALGLAITDWPLGVAGQWNDIKADNTLFFVIEKD